MLTILAAQNEHLPLARQIFTEYAEESDRGICVENFREEVVRLPGKYAPPRGAILLAFDEGDLAGCVAIRPFDQATAEMKRLFVRPSHRSKGLGRKLVEAAIEFAVSTHNEALVLDTLHTMTEAQSLYRSLGFRSCPPFKADAPTQVQFFALNFKGEL